MKLMSREIARARGCSTYFTGEPCPKNHIAERYVSSCSCTTCAKEARTMVKGTRRIKQFEGMNRVKAEAMRFLYSRTKISRIDIARIYGIHPNTVYGIINRKVWL